MSIVCIQLRTPHFFEHKLLHLSSPHSLCSALELDLLCSRDGQVDPGRQSVLSIHQTCHLEMEPSPLSVAISGIPLLSSFKLSQN